MVMLIAGQPAHAAADPQAPVSPVVLAQLDKQGSAPFMVQLRAEAALGAASKIKDSDARAAHVYQQLTQTAQKSQAGLTAELKEKGVRHKAFWIANAVWVEGDEATVKSIAARPEVEAIEPVGTHSLIKPTMRPDTPSTNAVEWGLTNIGAPRVWTEFGVRGEGIVVANIDSGVDFDHPALVASYRGNNGNGTFDHNYNWFDAAAACGSPAPCDDDDHGTHTMGTMVGDDRAGNQIGVAPGARWIAAKACGPSGCEGDDLLAAGQWVIAPTDLGGANPRPDLHADVVNNSWGSRAGNNRFFLRTIEAWDAAGIFHAFSNGNAGPACNTTGSPADGPEAVGVGAYDINNNIASVSSRGKSAVDGGVKPDISAPGVAVRSSVPGTGYALGDGTSMAAPHVVGSVALVWAAAPSLKGNVAATRALLEDTATDVNATACEGTVDNNNVFGEGRLDAFKAVETARTSGQIAGTVTEAGGGPLAGVEVSGGGRKVTTGADGKYALYNVAVGEVTVTASKFGYRPATATVTVAAGAAVTRDFTLTRGRPIAMRGTVRDGSGHQWPLYARIDVEGRPGGPVFTNPATGRYEFDVSGDTTVRLKVTPLYPGYRTVEQDVAIGDADKTVDFAMKVVGSCNAPGYGAGSDSPPVLTETFDGTEAPPGWSVVNRTPSGGWAFTDVKERGNLTGGSGGFAIIDSDGLGSGNTQDTDLITPQLDLSSANSPVLRFNSDWRAVGTTDTADVDVSTDGGTTWTNAWHQTQSRRGPLVEEILLPAAANSANVRVRFRFNGTFAWWWEVDNVQVVDRICTRLDGGLVVGFTSDRNTGAGIDKATVASNDVPENRGVSAPTPDDPTIPDGFYWLFSARTGPTDFTATKAPYQALTKTVNVAANDATQADFVLAAGRITVTPTAIRMHQPYNSTRSTTVRVTNTGSAPAEVEVLERQGDFSLLGKRGARLVENRMKLSEAHRPPVYPTDGVQTSAAPTIDDAWTRLPNYPIPIYDNTGIVFNGKIYSIGGGRTVDEKTAFVYDPLQETWSRLPDMPHARSKPSVAAFNGKIYAIGGWDTVGNPEPTVDVFDPVTGAWSTLAGTVNPHPRAAAGTGVVGSKVYMVGGCADPFCAASAETVVFDMATGGFSIGSPYPHLTSWMSCGAIGVQVYCAGGLANSLGFDDAWRYDPVSDDWLPLPDMPLDLWGSQHSVANGMLVLAGGVTDDTAINTNRTVAYDATAGAWRNLPNAQFVRFRGAGACGVFKIGGRPPLDTGSVESEQLGGLGLCNDLPWLSTEPTTFTLAPGASRTVRVTLTAKPETGVNQPGTYTAQLGVRADTPYAGPTVDVTTSVAPPPTWGKIDGTVLGQPCSGQRSGVPATVRVNLVSTPDTGYTLRANSQGRFAYWVPRGRYEVIAAKDGWIPEVQRIRINAGLEMPVEFVLDPVNPCGRPATGRQP